VPVLRRGESGQFPQLFALWQAAPRARCGAAGARPFAATGHLSQVPQDLACGQQILRLLRLSPAGLFSRRGGPQAAAAQTRSSPGAARASRRTKDSDSGPQTCADSATACPG